MPVTTTPAGLLTRMLREAFEGPPGPWTYFTDTTPGSGMLGTIGELTAAEASTVGGPGRTTIAGHVHHVRSSLAIFRRELGGESVSRDRSLSWTVSTVDKTEWTSLRAELRREYESLLAAVRTHPTWDEDAQGVVMGAIAHTAYHLGAIRQRLPAR
jgi:hypothetical protein